MDNTIAAINAAVATWTSEDAKFMSGNASAGARARKALSELAKLTKARRAEITDEKNARKAAKEAK